MVLAVAVTVALAVVLNRPRRPARGVAAVLAALFVFALVGGGYVLNRYEPATFPQRDLDRMPDHGPAGDGRPVFLWRYSPPEREPIRYYLANLSLTFNRSVCCTIWVNDVPNILAPDGRLPDARAPRMLARFAGFHPAGFRSQLVERTAYYGTDDQGRDALRIERLLDGPRAAFTIAARARAARSSRARRRRSPSSPPPAARAPAWR
jgi:hypothetical protein